MESTTGAESLTIWHIWQTTINEAFRKESMELLKIYHYKSFNNTDSEAF